MSQTEQRCKFALLLPAIASLALSGCFEDVAKVARGWDESATYGCCLETKQFVCLNNNNSCPGIVSKTYEGGYDQCAGPKPSCERQDLFAALPVEASVQWRRHRPSDILSDDGYLATSYFSGRQAPESCLQLCKDGITDANCLAVKLAQEQRSSLQRFYAEVSTPRPAWSVTPEKLRQLFDIDADPCMRSALSLANGMLTNAGEVCSLRADVVEMKLDATILVPALLKGSWTRTGDSVKADFSAASERPMVTFHRSEGGIHPLTRQFGGAVRYLEANERSMYVQAESGCVGVLF